MFFGNRSSVTPSNATPFPHHPTLNVRGASRSQHSFSLPIPPVSRNVYQFMRRQMGLGEEEDSKNKEPTEEQKRQAKIQQQTAPYQGKLEEMQRKKEQGLAEIRRIRKEQMESALKDIKEKYTQEYDAKAQERRSQFETECQQIRDDFEREQTKRKQEGEEPAAKRQRLEELTENVKTEGDESGKEQKDDDSKATVTGEGGAPPTEDAVPEAPIAAEKPSEAKAKELEVINKQLDELGDTKKEMIWLLKRVIKAEQKQKDDSKPEGDSS